MLSLPKRIHRMINRVPELLQHYACSIKVFKIFIQKENFKKNEALRTLFQLAVHFHSLALPILQSKGADMLL